MYDLASEQLDLNSQAQEQAQSLAEEVHEAKWSLEGGSKKLL